MKRLLLLSCILAVPAAAQFTPQMTALPGSVPTGVNYQGRLEQNGYPVHGTQTMVFRVFNVAAGGTAVWTSANTPVPVSAGLFNTVIPIPVDALIGGGQRWLEVQVSGTALSPREQLNAVPYAMVAKTVEGTIEISSAGLAIQPNATAAEPALFVSSRNANVGLGTDDPAQKLHIASGTAIVQYGVYASTLVLYGLAGDPTPVEGMVYYNTTSDKLRLRSGASWVEIATGTTFSPTGFVNRTGDSMTGQLTLQGSTLTVQGNQFSVGGTTLAVNAGSVGLGTLPLAAGGRVDIRFPSSAINRGATTPAQLFVADNSGVQAVDAGGRLDLGGHMTGLGQAYTWAGVKGAAQTAGGNGGYLALFTQDASSTLLERLRIDRDGNVAIGNSNTGSRLWVQGSAAETYHLRVSSQDAGGSLLVVMSSGAVGIGTASPSATLNVRAAAGASIAESLGLFEVADAADSFLKLGNGTSADGLYLPVLNATGNNAANPSLIIRVSAQSGHDTGSSPLMAFRAAVNGAPAATRPLFQWQQGDGAAKMTMGPTGNVGLNTATPATLLDVNGDVVIRSSLTVVDQDVYISTTAGSRGLVFQDGTKQITAASEGITACPAGFTRVGDSGKAATFCIDTNARAPLIWDAAWGICTGLNDASLGRAHLCGLQEWIMACNIGAFTPNATLEWTSEVGQYYRYPGGVETADPMAIVRANNCGYWSSDPIIGLVNRAYRCCIR